jgi:aryl-alcohol dehydrogenase-like predicted oxidoreductase
MGTGRADGMHVTTIPGTGLCVSRFVFGTGGLLNAGVSSRRRQLLFAAVDAGFTHFDTAPYYGFGAAERDLAEILRARPEVTFTTKVGLHPPGGADQPAATAVVRKLLGRAFGSLSRPLVDFSVSSARRSLEGSLRRTGRDRVDLYLLHDPVARLVATDEWRKWLDSCAASGKIRYSGMALSADAVGPFLDGGAAIGAVIQLRDSGAGREADVLERYGRERQITYGYVSAALRADPHCRVADVLRTALERNRRGAVIVTSGRPDRLRQYAELAETATHD